MVRSVRFLSPFEVLKPKYRYYRGGVRQRKANRVARLLAISCVGSESDNVVLCRWYGRWYCQRLLT